METLLEGWTALAGRSRAATAVGAELVARWSEPHRRYHTLDHLRAVLAAIEPLAPVADDADAVRLAAWFHDAIYDGRPAWDEERSAQLAQALLPRCGVAEGRVAEVARLVRLTVIHDPGYDPAGAGDANGAVLCDADLAVLAGEHYDAYARAVREEYRHVPDELFRAGRAQVLRRLLDAPRLYRTARAHDLWEARARANVSAELRLLDGVGAVGGGFTSPAAARTGRDQAEQQLT
ncbi:HD domain-containing protein [Nonomuraea dietziae]|uniref:Putative metal-dependent HD superfamily phosphohydrolase n=1 Tax=Nonomuraea dietziae TaxID=65515 RepID=A0A7W5V191_9ACTN|nr:metal-dependent phosphohydrolase [Nonomuraea dietziae]MBB3726884.1 putative metal-dependent HD superfamily phosphohydrolase [Nonomuraea dietziae]